MQDTDDSTHGGLRWIYTPAQSRLRRGFELTELNRGRGVSPDCCSDCPGRSCSDWLSERSWLRCSNCPRGSCGRSPNSDLSGQSDSNSDNSHTSHQTTPTHSPSCHANPMRSLSSASQDESEFQSSLHAMRSHPVPHIALPQFPHAPHTPTDPPSVFRKVEKPQKTNDSRGSHIESSEPSHHSQGRRSHLLNFWPFRPSRQWKLSVAAP